MLNDDGIVLDDGTTARISETQFYMTTTTAQAGEVMSWLEYLLQCHWTDLNVQVASLTDEWAGMAVSGPKAREALQLAFPQADVSNEALPYMGCRDISFDGVTVRLLRMSFSEVTAERAELENAPAVFAEKRRALINEIEEAESARRVAADALAAAESVMAETDREAKASLEALSSAREACARAEERMEGTKRRLADIEREIHDMLEVEPHAVAALAEIEPGAELPPLAEIEESLEKLRRDRERLGAFRVPWSG